MPSGASSARLRHRLQGGARRASGRESPPGGQLNDGVPGERSISVACMHCSDAPCMAVCPGRLLLPHRRGRGAARQGHLQSAAATALCPARSARRSPTNAPSACAARWTSALLRRGPRPTARKPSTRSTAATPVRGQAAGLRQMCSTRRCSAVTATWWRTFSDRVLTRGKGSRGVGWERPTQAQLGRRHTTERRRPQVMIKRILIVAVLATGLSACGEKAQTAQPAAKSPTQSLGRPQNAYVAEGWKAATRRAGRRRCAARTEPERYSRAPAQK